MGWLRSRQKAPPPDPDLDLFRDAIGSLTVDGVLSGYVFTRVETFWGLGRPLSLQNQMWL